MTEHRFWSTIRWWFTLPRTFTTPLRTIWGLIHGYNGDLSTATIRTTQKNLTKRNYQMSFIVKIFSILFYFLSLANYILSMYPCAAGPKLSYIANIAELCVQGCEHVEVLGTGIDTGFRILEHPLTTTVYAKRQASGQRTRAALCCPSTSRTSGLPTPAWRRLGPQQALRQVHH